jgi:Dolichyl-phosphate-mannose-protein mannosyltransferase
MAADVLALPGARHRQPEAQQIAFPRALAAAPLLVILAMQAVLTARLLRIYPASSDESLYIYSGHQLIHELWHGGGSPFYETWLSGAPDLYPIMAAILDHIGGLYLVREASMAFMTASTCLLYATTQRIFGYWPAVAAAGVFASLGVTQDLGVLATYDALSLLLMALAAYCVVRATGPGGTKWLLLTVPILALANWVKYASLLFDPVVIGLGALLLLRREGWRRVGGRAAALSVAIAVALGSTVYLAGSAYVDGIMYTTLNRQSGAQQAFGLVQTDSARTILTSSWSLIGIVIALGTLALIMTLPLRHERGYLPVLVVLVVAGMMVTAEGLHLRTDQSMSKHDDFGIWFTSIAAGYALARAAELTPRWPVKLSVGALALAAVAWSGVHYSDNATDGDQSRSDTDMAAFTTLRSYLALPGGRFLLGGLADYRMLYDNRLPVPWWQFTDDEYVKYPLPGRGGDWHGQADGLVCGAPGQPVLSAACVYLEGISGYQAAIHAHAFAVVSMLGGHGTYQDSAILAALRSTPGYVLLTTLGGAPTYIYAPDYPGWQAEHRTHTRTDSLIRRRHESFRSMRKTKER